MKTFTTKEGWCIDWRLRQRMAPILTRMIEALEANGTTGPGFTDKELAAIVHGDRSSVGKYLRELHDVGGIVRVSGWDTTGPGDYDRRWSMADGRKDAKRPTTPTPAVRTKKRRANIARLFGRDAWKVLQSKHHGGADSIVRCGKVLYRRGEGVNYQAAEYAARNA